MRTGLTLLTVLFCASAWGQAFSIFDPAMQAPPVVSAAPTYLVSEDCEGAGTPSGWINTGPGTIDWDYATEPLAGSQSLQLTFSASSATVHTNVAAADSYECYFRCEWTGISGSAPILISFNAGSSQLGYCSISSAGVMSIIAGGGTSQTVGTFASNIVIHCWFRFERGSGSNATMRCFASTDETKGNWISSVNGTSTSQISRIVLGSIYSRTGQFVIDKIRISTSEIGSNPP